MRKKTLSWLLAALMVGSLVISLPITASADGSAAGNAAVFDATSNSYIEVPDSDSLDATNALTVEAWIKPDNGGEWALIMGKQWNSADANPWYSYRLLAASANPSEQGFPRKVAFQIAPEGSGETGVESTTVVQNDVWTHVAGVYDGSSVKIYINGELEGSNPVKGSIRTSDLPLYLGKAPWTNNNNFNGMIDEVRVWNVARTAAQIDYDMRHTLTGDEPGLVGYWNFDEVSGNTAADATDNSNDGTLNNGAAFAASDTLLSLPDETEIIVANTDNHSIDFFHIAADGNAAPSRTIKGSSTNLNRPVDVALYDGKLYVLNHVAHAIEVFDPAATGDTAPVRRIIGGMSYPSGFDFDTTTQEIFVANYSGDITVYNASDSGIVTPKRTIAKYNAMTVAVSGSELFVTTYTKPAVYVYNKTTGNLLRTIQGANTGLSGNLYGVAISDGELFISDAVNNAIHVFNLTDSGDTEPKRTISGSNTLLGMPRELHIADNKLYIANKNNSVLIFGLMASGNVAPVQVLSGTETTFNAIQGVTVAESDTDDPPETPLLIQSTETRLVDFFPKTTQGENGIYLQRAQNGTYSNLDNFGDFTFKTTDTAWNLPIVILGDKAGNKDNEIIQAEPSTAENSAIRVTLNGDYGLVHVTGSAQMTKASGSARFFIYKGEYGYTEPLWQATLSGLNSDSFDLSIPYTEGEQLFFSIDANGPDTDDWAAWNQIRFIAASDSVSPVLTAGAVYRTSATDATVRFVSDSAGTYYYQVTNSSTTPAVDDLSGWTSGDAVSADTITAVSPAGLTAGAKYVHIVAEDAADNLSDVLTVAMPYDLYYFDDFEAYAANAYPAYYFQKYNGAGDAEQKVISVVQADAATGNVFRLKGQGSWASNQRVMLPAGITGTVTLEYDVKLVTHGGGVAFGRNDVTWSGGIARVDTTPAGMFSAGIGDGTVVHTSTTTCEVGPWYHVALELDYVNRTFNYYVDGIKLNDGALNAHTGYTLDYFGLGSSNAGGDEIYYDNVEVYGGALTVADAPAPILQSAATNTDGTKVILTFDKAMAAPTGESAEFAVIVNDSLDPVIGTALDPSDAKNIVLTLTTPIVYGDTVTVSYPPGGSIESSDGGVLATFTDQAVTNMVADTTAPVLTAGSVSRISDTVATVKFTSDEAGEYYYAVVASGDSAPAIDTEDVGIPCDSSEQTISLTALTAGAKDIYIVVKDAAGNVSSSNFKISIPAYVPAAHGSIQFESGNWSVPEDYSSHGYVERVGGSDGIITVDYYTVDDTAVAGTHYAAQSGTLTWADGDSAPKTIPFTINNDNNYNGYLQFSYVLSSPTGGAVLGSQDTLLMQIRDNDNPPIPLGLTATAGNGKVTLNWNEVKDAYYRVYFSTTSASYNEADSVDVYDETSTVITGLKNGTKYYFVVKAVHDIYLSPGSNEVSATPTSGNGGGSSISPDTGSQITVSTTDDSTSVTGTLTRVNGGTQIDIKNRAFDKLDAADKPVSINTRIATVTFDKKAMDAIGTESGDEDVTITARQVSASELSRKERALVGSRPVYDFTVTGGGKTISSFGGGYATVSIPYTLLPGENPQAVVIWYLSDSGTLESVRGCYDAATKTVTFVTPHFSRFVIGYNLVAFSDITSSAWYYDAVTFLAARGVTTGTTAATFSPDDTLTRGQFIVMLLRAYGIESDSTAAHNFSDSGNTYYTGYLAAAKRLGITNGVGNNRFAPEQSITRQEMFTLLYNALRVIGAPPASTAGRTLTDFSDASAIAPWAKDAMTLLVESGTVSGSGGKLNPTGITTRGEMAQVLYNLLSK